MANEFFSPNGDLEKYFVTEKWLVDQYIGDSLFLWGDNDYSQLGLGSDDLLDKQFPNQPLFNGNQWKQVICSGYFTVAIKIDGTLWSWGINDFGQLGLNDAVNRSSPTQIGTDKDWKSISCGLRHCVAIKSDGSLWAWGSNSFGQLGLGDTTTRIVPTRVGTDYDWNYIACGGFQSLALKHTGSMFSFGDNDQGQLGLGDTTNRTSPTQVLIEPYWKMVSTGRKHTVAIHDDGSLWSWGQNIDQLNYPTIGGLLGLGSSDLLITIPTLIDNNHKWRYVSCGGYHTGAIRENNSLWMWGRNDYGQLGVNDINSKDVPTEVNGENFLIWKQVSCGDLHTLGLKLNATLWFWGDNSNYQSGFLPLTTTSSSIPKFNDTKYNWKQISSGFNHSAGVICGSDQMYYLA